MCGTRFRVFRLLGIPIFLDFSWLVILALLTWTLINVFREAVPDLDLAEYWVMGTIAALAFFTCIVLHELGHALVARATGIPVRGITLFLFGGVAELEREPASAQGEFLMATSGPVVSAVLAGAFWFLAGAGEAAGWAPQVVVVLTYLFWINAVVLLFNLIPAFPLDGGRVLRSALWGVLGSLRRATYWAALLGQGFAWFLILLGVAHFFTGHIFHGVWLGLIGLFLKDAAQGSYQQVLVRQLLQGEPVSRFMTAEPVAVPPSLGLREWVEDFVYRYHRKGFPVVANGRLEGFISTEALAKYPRDRWDFHTVSDVMRKDLETVSIPPDADALEALGRMQSTGSSRLLVVEGDKLLGIVSLKDLLRFLNLKIELEGEAGQPGGRTTRTGERMGILGRPYKPKSVNGSPEREHTGCH
jgi:Zn-dependent protease/CBS domain-containing protein